MLVVDTCILIDIADEDPEFGRASAQCLADHLDEGLSLSPISYVELAPVFDGSVRRLQEFLDGLGVEHGAVFDLKDRKAAFSAWARYTHDRRAGKSPRRPVADALIGAMAVRCGGIVTRNAGDFHRFFPTLRAVDPLAAS